MDLLDFNFGPINMKTISLLAVLMCLCTFSCTAQTKQPMKKTRNKTADQSSGDKKVIISAPLVQKTFVKKNGERTDIKEWYIRRSIQDYFIKFCESEVSLEALENYLEETEDPLNVAKLEVEFKDGEWDICDEKEEMQSRIGQYVIIHRIIQ